MSYLLANLWGWLLAALILGLIIGWVTCGRERDNWFSGWIPWALAAFAIGLVLALLAWLPGRAGYWLETALLLFAAYVVGCCLGCWTKQLAGGADAVDAPGSAKPAAAVAGASVVAAAAVASAAPARPAAAVVGATSTQPANYHAGGPLTPLPEPVFSALRGHAASSAPGAVTTPAPGPASASAAAVAPAGTSVAAAVADVSVARTGAITGLPEPVASALRQRIPASPVAGTSAPSVSAPAATASPALASTMPEPVASALRTRAPAPASPVVGVQTAAARPAVVAPAAGAHTAMPVSAAAAAGGTPGNMPEPVASALRQRLPSTHVPVVPHIMSGLPRPAPAQVAAAPAPVAPAAAAAPAFAPRITPAVSPAPTATIRPVSATSGSVMTGLPEPVASALRQHIPHSDIATAQLGGAGVRVTSAAAAPMAAPAPVTLAHGAPGETVRLEAHVGDVTTISPGAAALSLHGHPGTRPRPMPIARGGKADDLLLVKGIGPRNEQILHGLGIYHFDQIAHWTPQEAEWVGSYMRFPGRIEREHWIAQCRLLAAGGETEHARGLRSGALKRGDIGDTALSEADAHAIQTSLGGISPSVPDEDKHEGHRPVGLTTPRGGKADDLKRVRGIGPQNEGRLHALGIWHFSQIAHWTVANVQWVGSYLAFPGRIDREEWIAQAKVLASGQATEFSRRVDAGEVATSKDDGSKGQGNVAPREPKA